MKDFNNFNSEYQTKWRKEHLSDMIMGKQNGHERKWILPEERWEEGLWQEIRSGSENSLNCYLDELHVQKHIGAHNLKSSWILCANLYFPFRIDLDLIAGFLQTKVCAEIDKIERIELEFAEKSPHSPAALLSEPSGIRGANQTSPDLAFIIRTISGKKGLILVENKYTEHSFYSCSGRAKKYGNPDSKRCLNFQQIKCDLKSQCWQLNWEGDYRANRRYWDYFKISSKYDNRLRFCPAAIAGYQLFRQQALAEALLQKCDYDIVYSCVAYDDRNEDLTKSMQTTGIEHIEDWIDVYEGKSGFAIWTHQDWLKWVKQNGDIQKWQDWYEYVITRYTLDGNQNI